MSNFEKYSAFYDLLYQDKDYSAEAEYVARRVRNFIPHARSILELGSGTGRHGRLLAAMGFEVYGIERSAEMVSFANANRCNSTYECRGSFTCEVGDIRNANLGRTFDAVISLFHVMSYQTTNQDLQSVFKVAANHLRRGGLFLFDVWHGPAVLSQIPSVRVKEVADARYRVKRTGRPELDTNAGTVNVVYELDCEIRSSGVIMQFSEEHKMRYLFPTEVDLLAQDCWLKRIATEEFLSGIEPSPSTWGVTYFFQKNSANEG